MSGVSPASSIHELLHSAGNAEKVTPISVAVMRLGLLPDRLINEVETSAIADTAIPTNRFAQTPEGTVLMFDAPLASREQPSEGRCYRVSKVANSKSGLEVVNKEPRDRLTTNPLLPKSPKNQGCHENSQCGSLQRCSRIVELSPKDDFSQEPRALAIAVSNYDTKQVVAEPIGWACAILNKIGGGP